MGWKVLWGILIFIGAFIIVTLIRALFYKPKKKEFTPLPEENVDLDRYIKNLQTAISIPTVSYATEDEYDWKPFEDFHAFLDRDNTFFSKHEK